MTIHSIVPADGPNVSVDGSSTWNGVSIAAGDTFEVSNGAYDRLEINNCVGTSGNEITFVNTGGQAVFSGSGSLTIHLEDNNEYILFRGDGDAGYTYGFLCNDYAFRIRHGAENITVSYVHRYGGSNRAIGFHVAQDNVSATELATLEFHHCKAEIVTEGWYNGNTGAGLADSEYRLSDITIRDCTIDDCYDGIQHNRDYGTSNIYSNTITNGRPGNQSPYNGAIVIGHEVANANIYNNHISDHDNFGISAVNANDGTSGDEIAIYNNLIYQCGFHTSANRNDAIKIGGATDTSRRIYNNTFIEIGYSGAGQAVNQSNMASDTDVYYYNNIALDIEDGTEFDTGLATPVVNSTNHTDASYTRAAYGFTDESNGDFSLTQTADGVDAGYTGEVTPDEDIRDGGRDANPDVGAYEFIAPVAATDPGAEVRISFFAKI